MDADQAKIRIRVSCAFATAGALVGAVAANGVPETTVGYSVLGAYLVWGTYWGVPPVWRAWWSLFENVGCVLVASPVGWLILLAVFFQIPLIGGYLYGVMGGGAYEYWKCRRVALGLNCIRRASASNSEPTLEELMAAAEERRSYESNSDRSG